jgi:hypothetical protein
MAIRTKDDGDIEVMERDEHMRANVPAKREEGSQQDIGVAPLVVMTGGDPLTVTHQNPTPPTNFSYNSYGTPPTPPAQPFVDDGTAGATTAIATPLSAIAGVSGTASEATGTVVIDTDTNNTTSITVEGAYTNTPNASHPSSNAPATNATITSVAPPTMPGTGGTINLLVIGTGFEPQSKVSVDGVPMVTQFNSPTGLRAMNAPVRTSAGTSNVTVTTGAYTTPATTWTFT